jgi:hypothetical protein
MGLIGTAKAGPFQNRGCDEFSAARKAVPFKIEGKTGCFFGLSRPVLQLSLPGQIFIGA